MRYVELPPGDVIKRGLLGTGGVTESKPPVGIELDLPATLPTDAGGRYEPHEQEREENNLSEPEAQIVVYNKRVNRLTQS